MGGELGAMARGVVAGVINACQPGACVDRAWPGELGGDEPVVLIAAGKGSVGMARAAVERLGARVNRGVVVGPEALVEGASFGARIERYPADHPLATARNVRAAERVLELAASAGAGETLLTLISGGASAHLTLPGEGVGLEDVRSITDALLRSGAPIGELNSVRKHLELVKGGGLARAGAGAGSHWSLVLSDVLGDRLDVIGSGPTAADPSTFGEALGVLERRGLVGVSGAVVGRLRRGAAGAIEETPSGEEAFWSRVRYRIVGNNGLAVERACAELERAGFAVVERVEGVTGEAGEVGARLAARVLSLGDGVRRAVVWGGETTVRVGEATGLGGRSQELALRAAVGLAGRSGVGVIAFGTDGIDGPTDAAGAVVDGGTVAEIGREGVGVEGALREHDSHRALERGGALIRTGPSGTNVNDLMIGLSGGAWGA